MNELNRRFFFLTILSCLSLTAMAGRTDIPQTEEPREVRHTVPAKGLFDPKKADAYNAALGVLKDPNASEKELDAAMQAMEPWLSTTEQVNALIKLALNRPRGDRIASNAALRLRDGRWAIPEPYRVEIQDMFRQAVLREKGKPYRVRGMLWALAGWGDSDWIWEHFAKTLRDDHLKVWVLARISDRKTAVAELLAMIDRCRPKTTVGGWQNRHDFAMALVGIGDKRGVDITIDLLTVGQTFLPEAGSPNSVRFGLKSLFGILGYEPPKDDSGKPREPVDELKALTAWWKANREEWAMDPPDALPADKPLNARQARLLAARLANEAYAKVTFKTPTGRPVGTATVERFGLNAEFENGKWICRQWGSLGPQTKVTFDARGGNPKVSIDYVFFDK